MVWSAWKSFFHFSPDIGVIDPCMISVSVCASGDFYRTINFSADTQWIEFKFCIMVSKAIGHINLEQLNENIYMLTRGGNRCGPKLQFFQFFEPKSGTTSGRSLIFWYVMDISILDISCFCTKSQNQLLHGLFEGQSWQKWHMSPISWDYVNS